MKRRFFSTVIILVFLVLCVGCNKEQNQDEVNNSNSIEETQGEQLPEEEIEDSVIIGEGEVVEEEPDSYQEPYTVVQISSPWQQWYVEKGEVKEIEFSEYSAEIIPGEKDTKFTITSSYINGKLYLGRSQGYHANKIPQSDDKILLESFWLGLDFDQASFRVLDINTKEILTIYPDNVEKDYYVNEVWVSPDLSEVAFMTDSEVYYYDGTQVTELEPFNGKIKSFDSYTIMMKDGKLLVIADGLYLGDCYIYDFATNELTECNLPNMQQNVHRLGSHYGYSYRDGYFTIIDLLTGREDKTELSQNMIRHVQGISEDWCFVLADYAYFIEKSTGRIIAKTEFEIARSNGSDTFTVDLLPSDEDIYFCIQLNDSEEKVVYKIELD